MALTNYMSEKGFMPYFGSEIGITKVAGRSRGGTPAPLLNDSAPKETKAPKSKGSGIRVLILVHFVLFLFIFAFALLLFVLFVFVSYFYSKLKTKKLPGLKRGLSASGGLSANLRKAASPRGSSNLS